MSSRRVYVCDKITMQVLREYGSTYEAARKEGESVSTVYPACRNRRVSRWGRVVYRYADDYDPDERFDGKSGRPIVAVDYFTKKRLFFYTAEDAAKYLGVHPGSVHAAIKEKRYITDRYRVGYAR